MKSLLASCIIVCSAAMPIFAAEPETGSKVVLAKVTISTLEKAVQVYNLKNDRYPEKLEVLLEGEKPILEPKKNALLDPWGRQYQYEPTGPKNKGAKPDIWTETPDKQVIGNWTKAKS